MHGAIDEMNPIDKENNTFFKIYPSRFVATEFDP